MELSMWRQDLNMAVELQPILGIGGGSSQRLSLGAGFEDWESILFCESVNQDQSMFRWISGEVLDAPVSLKQLLQPGNDGRIDEMVTLRPSGNAISWNEVGSVKMSSDLGPDSCGLNNINPNLALSQQFQTPPNLDIPSTLVACNNISEDHHWYEYMLKRHNPGIANYNSHMAKLPCLEPGFEFSVSKQLPQVGLASQLNSPPSYQFDQKPFIVPKQEVVNGDREQIAAAGQHQQQQYMYDQLYEATDLILIGNFSHAQAILARLNHHISPNTKPFQRAAIYFKEALQMALLMCNPATTLPPKIPTPVDGTFKMGAYKVLSEVSPLSQFMNFTSNQAILEALGDVDTIHILDFDIGFGAQWSSFLQELPSRDRGVPSLKITAFASPTTHHHFELGLMYESLTQIANDIGVSFELEVINFDAFDPNCYPMPVSRSSHNEAIAVNLPIWSMLSHIPSLPSLLRFIKNLSPNIIVSTDCGCEKVELPAPQHLLHGLQYYEVLLDSIDAANATSDAVNKIERFLFQPRIESMVLGRLQFPQQMAPWRSLFASMGFSPVAFSNVAESQADCVAQRAQIRGFCVEKRQASLVLRWKHHDLISASAWRC